MAHGAKMATRVSYFLWRGNARFSTEEVIGAKATELSHRLAYRESELSETAACFLWL